jgi:hypothetical protein
MLQETSINYPVVNVYITMENDHFEWVDQLFLRPFSMSLFVCLPEGISHEYPIESL